MSTDRDDRPIHLHHIQGSRRPYILQGRDGDCTYCDQDIPVLKIALTTYSPPLTADKEES